MNQTKKRLSIINLAISITDIETIQLQILQLGPLRTDEKIQEILTALKAENYAQAQGLIATYIDTPTKEILQRTFQKEQKRRDIQENNTIDEFNLLADDESNSEIKTFDFEDMLAFSEEKETIEEKPLKTEKKNDFDSLLNLSSDDILPNNIKIDLKHSESNAFWDEPEIPEMQTKEISKDTFFDTEENRVKNSEEEKSEIPAIKSMEEFLDEIPEEPLKESMEKSPEKTPEETFSMEPAEEEKNIDIVETIEEEKTVEQTLEETGEKEEEEAVKTSKNKKYKAIPYIDQKFKNMNVQYPPVQESMESFPSVDAWLLNISNNGYSEEEIEAMIQKVDSLSIEDKAEAAQLLLITAATESKYAQFRLARTLYKGEILQKNLAESFTLINRLATNDDYPEAICDLAQFYEHGIGIGKDKKKAESLYEEAMDLGISRAADHYKRIRKQNSGLFSFLKK